MSQNDIKSQNTILVNILLHHVFVFLRSSRLTWVRQNLRNGKIMYGLRRYRVGVE
jgi:hypothetical protein